MATEVTKMVLTAKEAIFLSAVLGENTLVGVEDPFLGWLAEQVEEEWQHSRDEMVDKGFLTNSNMKMQVRDDIKTALHICCEPDLQILMEQSNMAGHIVCHIVSATRSGASLAVMHTIDAEVSITQIKCETSSELVEEIMAELVLCDCMISDAGSVLIQEELLVKALGMPESEKKLFLNHVTKTHMNDDFVQAICCPHRKLLVSSSHIQKNRIILDSFGLFIGSKCIVRMHASEDRSDRIVVDSVTPELLQIQFLEYLS